MALSRLKEIHRVQRAFQSVTLSPLHGSYWSPLNARNEGIAHSTNIACSCSVNNILGQNGSEFTIHIGGTRWMSMMKVPRGAQQTSLKVTMLSPGFVYEPYEPRRPIPFWRRWFTPIGWRRTKEDLILEMKTAYAIARLRKKKGYSKKVFYHNAITLYKEVMANGDITSLRKIVTEKMYSTLKNELKRRESVWDRVYWELVEPLVRIRTLRARMIALDKNDIDKAFIQLTVEFLAKQRFEAYDSRGSVVAGDKNKEVLVRDIWVFECSLFHPGADWRLCARLSP
ncbi:uncharacterized protein LOC110039081 isoform X2 [Phalaenopsis equestris]|uniref:uncharacterized protein LOC110039081 isoform X2 n=1 Tax=Phalaenopsis equestris TaxID=78828 RepID=UPI0009E35A23|nr:uncharacterized protein LOC110039081 isoform X2 [Phalaenopsis equestris]